jgi:signal transduction histidine kinase
MTRKFYSNPGLATANESFVEGLQRSNKLLLEANEELRKAIRARSEYINHKSHALRTPLNIIIGFSELMLDEVTGKINEEQRQNLTDILSNGRRLLELIDDILALFKKESGENREIGGGISPEKPVKPVNCPK